MNPAAAGWYPPSGAASRPTRSPQNRRRCSRSWPGPTAGPRTRWPWLRWRKWAKNMGQRPTSDRYNIRIVNGLTKIVISSKVPTFLYIIAPQKWTIPTVELFFLVPGQSILLGRQNRNRSAQQVACSQSWTWFNLKAAAQAPGRWGRAVMWNMPWLPWMLMCPRVELNFQG